MASLTTYLLIVVVFIFITEAINTCPNQCMCPPPKNVTQPVLCLDPAMASFPAALPPDTGLLEIKGSYSQRSQFSHLAEGDLKGLTKLKSLIITHTLLDRIDEKAFEGLSSLVSLDLSFNRLTSLPGSLLSGLPSLAMLHLTGNQHLNLQSSQFQGLNGLKDLFLSDLALTNLDLDLFSGLMNLATLDLSNNELTDIPPGVTNPTFLPGLRTLDLTFNQMTYISNDTSPLFRRVSLILLGGNPLDCTCELKWLQAYRSHIFPANQPSLAATCQTPESVAYRALALLSPDSLICITPRIVSCDPVGPQQLGTSFEVRCNMTGLPFPFVSWKTADGRITIGSSRHQVNPFLDLDGPKVTMTLMATQGVNGTLTIMAQNVYGMGEEKIDILIVAPTTTTATTTTTVATTTTITTPPKLDASPTTKEKAGDEGGGGGMITYIAAGAGGAALLISGLVSAVACRKMNKAKVDTETKKQNARDNDVDKDGDVDDDDEENDDYDMEEMDYGQGDMGGGGRPPTAPHAMSAWDV